MIPLVYLFDYPVFKEALLNLIGNTTMFIPIGIIWPVVFKKLDAPWKVLAAGMGFSLCIEILQLLKNTLLRLKNTCYGNKCPQGECVATGKVVLRFLQTVCPEEKDWIKKLQ